MLTEDDAVPSFPSWTANGFFSLNTRPGLTVHRRNYDTVPRLRAFPSVRVLSPLGEYNLPPVHDELIVPSNKLRRKVFGRDTSQYPDFFTPVQLSITRHLKKRRKVVVKLEDHEAAANRDDATEKATEDSGPTAKFNKRLPTWQRKAWESFPGSLSAPIPFSTVGNIICDADLVTQGGPSLMSPSRQESPLQSLHNAVQRGNSLAHFMARNQKVFVLSRSGTLDSVTAYSYWKDDSGSLPSLRLRKYASSAKRIPDIITFDKAPVSNIITSRCLDGNEGVRLLATTSSSVCLAKLSFDGVLNWEDHLDAPNVTASAFNPLCPEEFSILSSDGLFCGTCDGYRAWCTSPEVHQSYFRDVQCLSPEAQYYQVEYGIHPRTVLLAARKELALFDLRTRRREDRVIIVDLLQNPESRARGSEIGTFCIAPNSDGFRLLLATKASLSYVDIRRPEVPLLDWSLVLPSAPDMISSVPFNSDASRSDLVLLTTSRWGQTDLFHAVHTGELDPPSSVHGDVQPSAYRLPKCRMMWSDLPVPRSCLNSVQDVIDGIALTQEQDKRHASVLQWSRRSGLTLHPFGVDLGRDQNDAMIDHSMRNVDRLENSVNLNNSIKSLRSHPTGRCSCMKFPVSRSTPGSYLQSRLKRLLLRDVTELRKRICFSEDDDSDNENSSFVPRPYMRDLLSGDNEDNTSTASAPEGAPSGQSSPRVQPAQKDDNADRETVIGEAAILRSQESDDSDNPQDESLDFFDAIGSGCLFDELARSVRSGFGHLRMPLGVAKLRKTVSDSPLTKSFQTAWHARCDKVHAPRSTAVSTATALPGWVSTTVYHTTETEKGESLRNSSIPESSYYGLLLARMQTEFFE